MNPASVSILLIEDEEAHSELVRRAFESRGDHVRLFVANSLSIARAHLEKHSPDLIVADWRLPDGEGVELLSDKPTNAQAPVVIMTSYGNERIAVDAMKAGALDYVVKSEATLVDMPHIADRAIRQWRMMTERKRIQDNLRESEERFRSFVEQSSDGVALLDEQGIVIEWNHANEQITGLLVTQVIGKRFWDVLHQLVLPARRTQDHYDDLQSKVRQALVDGQAEYFQRPVEMVIHKPTGEQRAILQTTFPIQTNNGHRVGSITRDVTERLQREHELQAIADLSLALRAAPTRTEMLPIILTQIVTVLQVENASIEMLEPQTGDAVVELGYGGWQSAVGLRIPRDAGLNVRIHATGKPYLNNDLLNDPLLYRPDLLLDCHSGAGAPMLAHGEMIGFLWIGRKTIIAESEVRLLAAIADIAANAIRRATLYEQTLRNAQELAGAYDATIAGWARAMDLRDQEISGHSLRVAEMTLRLARAVGIPENELVHIRRGALLHDLGKMALPDKILHKPSALTPEEWQVMRRHPAYAYDMLSPIAYLRPALDIPYCHHEKWDGSGYPRGLEGEAIPFAARIFSVIDVWDALRSARPYRPPRPSQEVYEYIRDRAGSCFDPQVVQVFLTLIQNEPQTFGAT